MIRLVLVTLLLSGCSTTVKVGGREFVPNTNRLAGIAPTEDSRGYMAVEHKKSLCQGGDNTVRSGYFLKPRQPNKGETTGQYQNYLNSQRFRVSECARVGLWCSTDSKDFCNGVEDCSDRVKNIKQSNCVVQVTEQHRSTYPNIGLLTEKIGMDSGGAIMCAMGEPHYTSQLHSITTTSHGWKEDRKGWETFCRKHKSENECSELVQVRGPAAEHATSRDVPYSQWAMESLSGGEIAVHEENGVMWADVQLDVSPTCEMLEQRH